jgi:hypothetical protein
MHFLSNLLAVSTALTVAVSAIPFLSSEPSIAKRSIGGTQLTKCDLSKVQLPRRGSPPQVPSPSNGLHLKYALLGRGTQNYTCSGSGAPTPVGAIAILYDASCLAAYHSSLLHELVPGFLQFDQGEEILAAAVFGRFSDEKLVAGHHYFLPDKTTAVFDMRVNGQTGYFEGRKTAVVDAPDYAYKGKNNEGDGAVPWLKLKSTGKSVGLSEGFRMITAGGEPPKSCSGQPGNFEVPYAAEYYFYGQ